VIREGSLAELRARGGELFAAAAAETGVVGAVRWDVFESYEQAGVLVVLLVADDLELVGWCGAVVSPELFGEQTSFVTLTLFVRRDHRGRFGRALLRAIRAAAADHGADVLRVQAVPGSRLERLLRREGLTARSVAYEERTMHYIAHGCRHRDHLRFGPRLRGLLRRAATHGPEEGRAAPGDRPTAL